MRTYAKNFVYKKTVSYKERQERLATEWDVRLDISENLPVEDVLSHIRDHLDELLFVLVSGVEMPDKELGEQQPHGTVWKNPVGSSVSKEHHVHLCIVLLVPVKRADVLRMLRGPRKLGDEYCAPRNPKFTYGGWYIHHAKPGFKLDGEPLVRFEHGTLPMDPVTTDSAMKIRSLQKKWGTPTTAKKFKMYLEVLEHDRIKAKIEQLQMSLEDNDA